MPKREVIFEDLGRMDYRAAWDYQEALLQEAIRLKTAAAHLRYQEAAGPATWDEGTNDPSGGMVPETTHHLLLTEHPPVYTLGKSGKPQNILISEDEMRLRDIAFFPTNRGGDITFHGPGQIVGYPILDLEKINTDIGVYLRNLEEVIILTLQDFGLKGERSPGETGVWMDAAVKGQERKICAIGVRCSRWITMHGFAFNVNTDLSYFENIIPCGIQNKQVTSLQKELGEPISLEPVKQKLKRNFERVFDCTLVEHRLETSIKNLSE